ncbi:unnamed protein product [Macrosiphum euphorbiae]|uniref:Uncharacterized protein n=1 Tax=Macrosiphum euphorbiae TaxID=13131 RepID=A0AAV0WR54_9HEMI|nr:unnamed protein product [Macrosiphum euphorbiae]
MINAYKNNLLFPQEVFAAQSNLARETMGYNTLDQGLKIRPYIDEQLISKLVEEKLNKMWGWFVGFGNFISGLLGVFVIWKIFMICLNTTINMSILYQTFGFSFKVLAGLFASMTHSFMPKSHTKAKQIHKIMKMKSSETYLLDNITEQPISQPTPQPRQIYPSLNIKNTQHQDLRRSL